MRQLPQAEHCDLGLTPEADQTPDLRPEMRKAPVAAEAFRENNHPNTHLKGQS